MAATPQFGTLIFAGLSGKRYAIDIYLSDVANAAVQFDAGAGASASSGTRWRCPESGFIQDYSQVTGTVDTTKIRFTRNGIPGPDILRYTIHLTTLNNRPKLMIPFRRGDDIAALQLA